MTATTFTPKEVARALGVSESSVKRWVDSGRLDAAKTAGGHRKVPVSSVVEFVRDTGQSIADPAALGMVATVHEVPYEAAEAQLFEGLINGQEAVVRGLVLGFYQRGESVAQIGDRLIGPAFLRIGDGWQAGTIQVFQERRACEVMMSSLHELRRWLGRKGTEGPRALIAAPQKDYAEVPARLVELVLLAAGWRVKMAGCGLPLAAIRDAVLDEQPSLVCLSATHLDDAEAFILECNTTLLRPLRALKNKRPRVAVGGGALPQDTADRLEADLIALNLADLFAYQAANRPCA